MKRTDKVREIVATNYMKEEESVELKAFANEFDAIEQLVDLWMGGRATAHETINKIKEIIREN